MGPRVAVPRKRKRWVVIAGVFLYLMIGIIAWVESDDFEQAFAAANAWGVGFGFLDAAPPTNTGHTNNAEQFDFAGAMAHAQTIGKYITVSTSSALASAYSTATAGTYIRITPGTYTWSSVGLSGASGTTARPVVVDGNNLVTISNITKGFRVTGSSNVVIGRMTFANTTEYMAVIENAPRVRLTQITGTGLGTDGATIGYIRINQASDYWRVDHCNLTTGGRQGVQLYWYKDVYGTGYVISRHGRVDRNTFAGVALAQAGHVQLGQGSNTDVDLHYAAGGGDAYATVEYNLFDRVGQNEGSHTGSKTSYNIYRYNYFKSCRGGIEWRAGTHGQFVGNYSSGCSRGPATHIIVYDRHNVVANNIFIQQTGNCSTLLSLWNGSGWRQLSASKWSYVPETAYNIIANNTVIAAGGFFSKEVLGYYGDNITYAGQSTTSGPAVPSHHNTIINNIFVATGTVSGTALTKLDTHNPKPVNDTISTNNWYLTGAGVLGAIYPRDVSPIGGNPNLSVAWVPQAGSPALDVGIFHTAIAVDYYGNNRAVGQIDLGAIQVTLSPPAQRGAGLNRGQHRGGYIGGWV